LIPTERPKAVLLFSGGLDSILALKLLEEQGVDVLPLHLTTPFVGNPSKGFSNRMEALFGIEGLITKDLSLEFLPLLKSPPHGFGSQMNPCIDCKILFLKSAREVMEERGAAFLATGEVVGQRPFSQRKEAMRMIEREAGVEGILLRPLSARLLPPTLPEREGIVQRERLMAIQGRSRKPQLELAKRYGLKEIPSPAGGCLLTDPSYAKRLGNFLRISQDLNPENTLALLEVLRVGRHFNVERSLLVVARNQAESTQLLNVPRGIRITSKEATGLLLFKESPSQDALRIAGRIVARYARGVEGVAPVEYEETRGLKRKTEVTPMPPEEVEEFLV